jgi:hypothetical protein
MVKVTENSKKGSQMKKMILPNRFQVFVMEVRETLNAGLSLLRRVSMATLSREYANEFRLQKHFKVMYRYDYTNKFIVDIDYLGMLGHAPNSEYLNETYRLYFNAERTDYRDVNGDEMISVFKRVKDTVVAQKAKPEVLENTEYAIAKIRKSRKGNDRFYHKNGRFNASYANRVIFKTMVGAENFVYRLVKKQIVKINTLKIVSR